MRPVAQYAFTSGGGDSEALVARFGVVTGIVDAWLLSKGDLGDVPDSLVLQGGRKARLKDQSVKAPTGEIREWVLEEPLATGLFRTSVQLGRGSTLAFACRLEAGHAETTLAPLAFETLCPRLVRDVLGQAGPWSVGGWAVAAGRTRVTGATGGQQVAQLIHDQRRCLPLVLISESDGFMLMPDIDQKIAEDLAGLASVVSLDDRAARELTATLGKEWSCYGGAIRIYWPRPSGDPFKHLLWTPTRLLSTAQSIRGAALAIRARLRRTVIGLSTYAIETPSLFREVHDAARRVELDALRSGAASTASYAEELEKWNAELEAENRRLKADLDRAQADNTNLATRLAHYEAPGQDEVAGAEPEAEAPPESLEDAVLIAQDRCGDRLVFGADVTRALGTVVRDAGPPQKILNWLLILADMTTARRSDRGLGGTPEKWLLDHGCIATGESSTIMNDASERSKRVWDAGGQRAQFTLHMKPAEATHPDRCVRIYFTWDDKKRTHIVGWVGRHP